MPDERGCLTVARQFWTTYYTSDQGCATNLWQWPLVIKQNCPGRCSVVTDCTLDDRSLIPGSGRYFLSQLPDRIWGPPVVLSKDFWGHSSGGFEHDYSLLCNSMERVILQEVVVTCPINNSSPISEQPILAVEVVALVISTAGIPGPNPCLYTVYSD
jgi:hypothetical protein